MSSTADLVKQLGDKEPVIAFYAYQELLQRVTRAGQPGNESARAGLAAELGTELTALVPGGVDSRGRELPPKPKYTAVVRNKLARLMSYIAGEDEIPFLVKAMGVLETREMARFALQCCASESATQALIAALEEVGPIFRVGVVNSLANRKGPHVLAALKKATTDSDREVRLAALEALSSFADPSGVSIIAQATKSGAQEERARAHRALLRLAETLRFAGSRAAATEAYRAIQSGAAEPAQKKAADLGLKSLS